MANTTNFGWETPDDTDLVKDGAAAMRTLGNAIDTSFVDLKGGTTGQMLTKASNTDLDYSWVTPQIGDITAVTAGTGLSGGGTSGDVTLTNTVATAFDAKGDLIVGTGADTFAKLTVGANDLIPIAASGETTGIKWGGAWETWTPTWTNLTIGNGTQVAKKCQIGKLVSIYVKLTFGSTTAVTGVPRINNAPTAVQSGFNSGNTMFFDTGVTSYIGYVEQYGAEAYPVVNNTAATYMTGTVLNTTVPFTWGNTDVILITATYEVA